MLFDKTEVLQEKNAASERKYVCSMQDDKCHSKILARKRNIFSMYINLVGGGCLRTKDCSFILPILEENQYIKTTDLKYFGSHHRGYNFPISPHALFI